MLSVIVPCFNEEEVLDSLVRTLDEVLPQVAAASPAGAQAAAGEPGFEVILVDDGSSDRTLELMREVAASRPGFHYVSLSRNFGKESAMLAGLSHARGDQVAILDADLQHPPSLLLQMMPLLAEGYDQVVARRTRSGDPRFRTAVSRLYYHLFNRLIDVKLQDGVGDFRLMTRAAVDALLQLQESNRFSKGMFAWIGFRTAAVDYENVARGAGSTKWRLRDLLNYGLDGVMAFNTKPLRLAIHLGGLVTLVALGYALWVLGEAVVHGNDVPGYVTTICTVVAFGGVQMMLLGVIGEYLGKIYLEVKHRPHFLVGERSGELPAAPPRVTGGTPLPRLGNDR